MVSVEKTKLSNMPGFLGGQRRNDWFSDPALRAAFKVFLVFRILTAIIAVGSSGVIPLHIDWANQPVYNLHENIAFTSQGLIRSALEPWYRWDTGWFIQIAYGGYTSNSLSIAFGPLYPVLIRAIAPFTGQDYLLASLLISNVSCFILLILLYKLVEPDFGKRTAHLTLWVYMASPAAYYLLAGYTESLFLMLVLGAWLSTQRKRYILAGLLACLAALTRAQGWVFMFPCGYLVFIQERHQETMGSLFGKPLQVARYLVAIGGGPLGSAIYLGGMALGGLGSVSAVFANQGSLFGFPWDYIVVGIRALLESQLDASEFLNLAAFLTIVILGLVSIRRLRPEYSFYVLASLLTMMVRVPVNVHFHDMIRYTIHLFPLFILLALLIKQTARRWVYQTYFVVACGLQCLLLILFTHFIWIA